MSVLPLLFLAVQAAAGVELVIHAEFPDGTPAAGAVVQAFAPDAEAERVLSACNGNAACAERALAASRAPVLRTFPALLARATAGLDGATVLPLPAGVVHVVVLHDGMEAGARVDARLPSDQRLVLNPTRVHPVHVMRNGKPRAGARVTAYTRTFLVLAQAVTDEQGRALLVGSGLYSAFVEDGEESAPLDAWNVPVAFPGPTLCGRVLLHGVPVKGAHVHQGTAMPEVTADEDGRFCVDAREDGAPLWSTDGEHASLAPMFLSAARIAEARIHLVDSRTVTGQVSLDGNAAPGAAWVFLEQADEDSAAQRGIAWAQPDDVGKFTFRGVPNVPLRVRVVAAGYSPADVPVGADGAVDVKLARLHPLTVRVERLGAPVPHAWVGADLLPPGLPVGAGGNTDLEGRLGLWLAAGAYAVTVGQTAGAARVNVPQAERVTIPVRKRLLEVVVVRGREAVNGALLEQPESGTELDRTTPDGRVFLWSGPDAQVTRVRSGGQAALVQLPEEGVGGVAAVKVRLTPPRLLDVRVLDAPVDTDVYAQEGEGAPLKFVGSPGADGHLVVALTRAEDARIKVFVPSRRLSADVEVASDIERITLRLREEGEEVDVRDDKGRPIPEVWRLGQGPLATQNGRVRAVVGTRGEEVVVDVQVPGMEPRVEPGAITRVRYSPCGYVVGVTLDGDGNRVRAPVEVNVPGGAVIARGFSAANGVFRMGCLPAGPLEISSPGLGARQALTATAGTVSGPVELRLRNAHWVAVTTVPHAEVGAHDPRTDREEAHATAGDDGVARLGPLPPGLHVVVVESASGARLARVEVGGATQETLALPMMEHGPSVAWLAPRGWRFTRVLMQAVSSETEPLFLGQPLPEGPVIVRGMTPGPHWVEARVMTPKGERVLRTAVHVGAESSAYTLGPVGADTMGIVPVKP